MLQERYFGFCITFSVTLRVAYYVWLKTAINIIYWLYYWKLILVRSVPYTTGRWNRGRVALWPLRAFSVHNCNIRHNNRNSWFDSGIEVWGERLGNAGELTLYRHTLLVSTIRSADVKTRVERSESASQSVFSQLRQWADRTSKMASPYSALCVVLLSVLFAVSVHSTAVRNCQGMYSFVFSFQNSSVYSALLFYLFILICCLLCSK